jgi:Cytochrome c oxidase biogenesis protein Cmc1 like
MSAPGSTADVGGIKDAGREGRLSFRKFAEHQLRNEFKQESMKKCELPMKAFADCAKTEGVFVVFRCREFQSAVNECMQVYMSNERWEMYKEEHAADLESKLPVTKR